MRWLVLSLLFNCLSYLHVWFRFLLFAKGFILPKLRKYLQHLHVISCKHFSLMERWDILFYTNLISSLSLFSELICTFRCEFFFLFSRALQPKGHRFWHIAGTVLKVMVEIETENVSCSRRILQRGTKPHQLQNQLQMYWLGFVSYH